VPLDAQSDDHDLKRMIEISACHLAFSTAADAKRLQVIAPSCDLFRSLFPGREGVGEGAIA
jgi:hypothetical protein